MRSIHIRAYVIVGILGNFVTLLLHTATLNLVLMEVLVMIISGTMCVNVRKATTEPTVV